MDARDASPRSTTSTLSNITVRTDKHVDVRAMSSASPSISTPPTSLDDEASIRSEATKTGQAAEADGDVVMSQAPVEEAQGGADTAAGPSNTEGRRSARNSHKSVTTYNVQILAGTAIHTPTKYLEKHHKNVVHGDLQSLVKRKVVTPAKKTSLKRRSTGTDISDAIQKQLNAETAQAVRRRASVRVTDLRKDVLRNISGVRDAVAGTALGGKLRRSASEPHLKSAKSSSLSNSRKRSRQAADTEDEQQSEEVPEKVYLKPKTKTWLKQGLFVGQHREFNPRLSESQNRTKRRSKAVPESRVLPLPLFTCDRLLNEDPQHVFRDYKLPFDTYNPLPRKVKVEGWTKLGKNRFIGDASALWKRDKQDSSQCYCDPEDGCGYACHNRIMAYECDGTNCPLTAEECGNRPFAELRKRAKGNRYDYGVEVVDTEDRGYGVRAMRTFEPHQIIVEYAGEIITQSECERRMKQVYKKDKCYYLMSFDNKMIIDATRGTIARFVNHSCEPNCEMIKWTVGGEPRMALFAGRRGIMTGEELTYDYNFDPFSQKNIQECRCGTESCRGVLGPKPKKPPVEEKSLAAQVISGTKRKIAAIFGSGRAASDSRTNSPKKRKLSAGAIKARNAMAQIEAAREQVEREAREHEQQMASRESRALKRNGKGPKRGRAGVMRTRTASVKVTRHTTVTFKRTVTKPTAKRIIKKPTKLKPSSVSGKGLAPSNKRPSTPVRQPSSEESESEDDGEDSPNITPASLRSASGRSSQQLQFSPISHAIINSRVYSSNAGSKGKQMRAGATKSKLFATAAAKKQKLQHRGSAAKASRGLHKTGAGVKKARAMK